MSNALRLVLTSLLAVPVAGGAQTGGEPRPAVDAVFAGIDTKGPGCAVGVGEGGRLSYARGYGMADLEHDVPITPTTPFYVASTSKQFAAFAIVLLARDGRLSLDDDVRTYIPELADFGTRITIRHLLHHTSGLRDYFEVLGSRGWPFDGTLTEEEFLRIVGRQRELNFPPGSQHLYSNTGYVLLSIVVQRVRGQSLRQFAQERIFAPLGMDQAVFRDDHRMLVPGRALAYEMIPGNALRLSVPQFDVVGDGGLYASVEDLVRWAGNAYTPKAGDARDWATLTTRGVLTGGDTIPYALGISHGTWGGWATLAHGGAFGGYRAELLRVPEARLDVAVLCNFAGADPSAFARRVVDAVLPPRPTPATASTVRTTVRPGEVVPTGTWLSRWTERWFRIAREGDSLVATGPFSRTRVTLSDGGLEIPSQRITLRRAPGAAGWAMSLGGAGREPLVAVDTTVPRQGAIASTMGDFISPESEGRLTLIVESGQLTLRRLGVPPTRLAPLGPNRFTAGPVVITMLGNAPFDSLRVSSPRASRVKFVRVAR
jgi:CubicO group peptidase (beta-lactamase class C family)